MTFKTLSAAIALVIAGPGSAASYLATFTGVVRSGTDATGEIAAAGTDLTGQIALITFRVTLPAPGAFVLETPTRYTLGGGANFGAPSFSTGRLTIGGNSLSFAGTTQSSLDRYDEQAGFYDGVFHESQVYSATPTRTINRFLQAGVFSDVNDIIATVDPTVAFAYTVQPGDMSFGNFYVRDENAVTGVVARDLQGSINFTTVSFGLAGVPEPASWAMMIGGFAMLGLGARRRARATALQPA